MYVKCMWIMYVDNLYGKIRVTNEISSPFNHEKNISGALRKPLSSRLRLYYKICNPTS